MSRFLGLLRLLAVALVAAAALVLVPFAGGAAGDPPIFSGQAKAVDATVSPPLVGAQHIVLADTGRFDGPAFDGASPGVGVSIPASQTGGLLGLDATLLSSSTFTEGDHVSSQTHVLALAANVNGIPITAELLSAQAQASCGTNGAVLSGSSELLGASVAGIVIDAATPRNTRIAIPGTNAYFIVDEQSTSNEPGGGKAIDVTALHVVVPGLADVAIASVHADVFCQGGPPNCNRARFVTGGGWVASGNDRANFAVAARNGVGTWGHLLYKDRFTGTTYRGTPADSQIGDTVADIHGFLDDGRPFEAVVQDNGEPGSSDTFTLSVAGGAVNSGVLQGGNIQIHKPCGGK